MVRSRSENVDPAKRRIRVPGPFLARLGSGLELGLGAGLSLRSYLHQLGSPQDSSRQLDCRKIYPKAL